MNKFRCFRKINPTICTKKYRCFSVAIRSAKHSTPLSFRLLKSTEADSNLEDTRFQSKIKEIEISKVNSERKLSLAKDRAFLKVLTSINLESKDNECILLSRLIAYNIINNIKAESNFSKETFTGIAKALNQILEFFFEKVSESATDEELKRKSSNVHQKGKFDVANLLNFLISDSDDKVLLFTKEVTTRPAEGRVNTHTGFSVDAGHSSHTFINDHVNYRVDMHHPIVYICEELTLEDANKVIELSLMKRSDVIFISNKVDADIQKYLISKNSETQIGISLINISESKLSSDLWVKFFDQKLKDLGEVSKNFKPKLKTVERVVMDGNTSTFIDSSFSISKDNQDLFKIKQIVDVHLRSSNEAWINKYKNDVTEAYTELCESKIDILADLDSSLYFASKHLGINVTENLNLIKGFEIVMKSIQSSLNSVYINQNEPSDFSYEDILKICKSEGTFISKSKAKRVIFDTVTICNYMLTNLQISNR